MTDLKALSQEQRVELVAKACLFGATNHEVRKIVNAYEATVVALEAAAKGWEDANRVNVIKLAAALERVKALEADKKHLRDTLMGARDVCLNGLALLTPKDPGQ
mgnify:CR=1 FL=1